MICFGINPEHPYQSGSSYDMNFPFDVIYRADVWAGAENESVTFQLDFKWKNKHNQMKNIFIQQQWY